MIFDIFTCIQLFNSVLVIFPYIKACLLIFFSKFLCIRADKGKDQYLFLLLEMVEENLTTVLTVDMQTVSSLLPLLESVEMEASQDMRRGVQQ